MFGDHFGYNRIENLKEGETINFQNLESGNFSSREYLNQSIDIKPSDLRKNLFAHYICLYFQPELDQIEKIFKIESLSLNLNLDEFSTLSFKESLDLEELLKIRENSSLSILLEDNKNFVEFSTNATLSDSFNMEIMAYQEGDLNFFNYTQNPELIEDIEEVRLNFYNSDLVSDKFLILKLKTEKKEYLHPDEV